MRLLDKTSPAFLYQQVIDFVGYQQKTGALLPGDKLPSLRKLSRQFEISVPTVKQAYIELERQGRVCARPQSGYYLTAQQARTLKPRPTQWSHCSPATVKCRSMIEQVHEAVHIPNTVALGISNPIQANPPDKTLARLMRSVISKVAEKAVSYGPVTGDSKLRMQLAFRYQDQGVAINPDEIVITNGAQEALSIALQCVANQGDIIAIESPCFFGMIELIETLGMKALEVYTCTEDGVCLDELTAALKQHPIKACLFSTAINNPLGSMKTDEQRQAIVNLLEEHDIPLIEDDVYSELYFSENKPKPAQLYSEKGLVMTCSSFSKTAAPGYRIGWLLPGKYEELAKRVKRAQSCSTPMLQQWTLNEYIQSGFDQFRNDLSQGPYAGIIVLGGSEKLSISTSSGQATLNHGGERLITAAQLAKMFPSLPIIHSGGTKPAEDILSENDVAELFFTGADINIMRIRFDDKSYNTHTNALESKVLIKSGEKEKWLLVTSAYHMPRSVGAFRKAGINFQPYPVDYKSTLKYQGFFQAEYSKNLSRFDLAIHEYIGLASYYLTNRSTALFPSPEK